MADGVTHLGHARELQKQSLWAEACDEFAAAGRSAQLDADDLELYAEAAQILGRGAEAIQLLRRAFNLRVDAGEVDRAITTAFWICQALIINAEFARASGWAAQVRRSMPDVDNGWLVFLEGYFSVAAADYDQAARLLARAADAGTRQGEIDLVASATTVWGRALIKAGKAPGWPQPARRGDGANSGTRHITADDEHDVLQRDRHLSRGSRVR
jgi:tetratricopeptide (TPR) repeat protein